MNLPINQLDAVIQAIANDLFEEGHSLYMVDGKCLFQMRGMSGGIATNYIFYIVDYKHGHDKFNSFGAQLSIDLKLSLNELKYVIECAYEEFKKGNTISVGEGGDMGTGNIIMVKK